MSEKEWISALVSYLIAFRWIQKQMKPLSPVDEFGKPKYRSPLDTVKYNRLKGKSNHLWAKMEKASKSVGIPPAKIQMLRVSAFNLIESGNNRKEIISELEEKMKT